MNLMLENLNTEQRCAVETTDGPLLVLSGAGTGKTRVLTTRIAYILDHDLARPWQILALTFTNKAANEMKARIAAFAADGDRFVAADLWCGTFHSVALRILRVNADAAGLRRDFLVYGEEEQKTVLKSVLGQMGLDVKDFKPDDWVERISAIKDKGLVENISVSKTAREIMDAYNAELARLGAVDFGDIILKALQMFDGHPEILDRYQRQFKYILVDEFQDTNNAQMQFLEMLTRGNENPNICCVGDDDQSIYSWRGAEIKHILNFEKTYPTAQIIRLETNYRSTGNILGAANSLVRHNTGRLGKDLRTADGAGDGEPVYVLTVPTDWDEARVISEAITRDGNAKYADWAILIRAGSLSRLFEEEFARCGIPYRLVGATKFYDRAEIRDAIAYLRLMVHRFDDLSFIRVISKPRRGFGAAAIAKLRDGGAATLMDGLRTAPLSTRQRAAADDFIRAFDFDWRDMAPKDAAQKLLEDSGYLKMWREDKGPDAPERLNNLKELVDNVIARYATMDEFLEHAALMTTDDNDSDAVNADAVSIMTIHAAKGLEFNNVFLPAWEEGIFPNEMSIDEGSLEEERRLAYVAITRARQRAIICNAMSRRVFGEQKYNSPSRFITEIDNRFLDFQGGAPRKNYAVATSYDTPRAPRVRRASRREEKKSLVGKLVQHNDMGSGVVIEDGGDILTIAFKNRGIKKVARDFISVIS